MAVLSAAVALVGCLCLLDLLLTFGVIRRLREHTALLSGSADPPVIGLATGASPGEFSALTTAGEILSGTAGLQVIGFFSSGCSACPERVPPFVEYLSGHRVGRDSVLAIVQVSHDEPPPYLDKLAEVAMVSVEPADGAVSKAFKVTGFPAFCLLDADGAVAASGYDPAMLPAPAAV